MNAEGLKKVSGSLLDTNIVINYIKGVPSASAVNPFYGCKVSYITIGELMFGSEKSRLTESNKARYLDFCNDVGIMDFDLQSAIEYGKIKNELKLSGSPIPENDVWLAAIARSHDMTFVSYDRHFERVCGLRLLLLPL